MSYAVDQFIDTLYPLTPIFKPESVKARFANSDHLVDQQFGALILAMYANVAVALGKEDAEQPKANTVMRHAVELHATASIDAAGPTLEAIATVLLLSSCLRAMGRRTAARLRLNEAIALIEEMGITRQDRYHNMSSEDRELAVCIVWKLAVGER